MIPQIALDLSLDGISVLSRIADAPGKWRREGIVRLDDARMAETLRGLRRRCAERMGEDFTSILILPDAQVLFTSLDRDDRDPKTTIRSLLEGRTPYPVDELVFDYVVRGDRLQVAVIARETLREAEDFVAEFAFQPVAMIADPEDSTFPGRPDFGRTALAGELLRGRSLDLGIDEGFETVASAMPDDVELEPSRAPDGAPPEPDVMLDPLIAAAAPAAQAPTQDPPAETPAGPSTEDGVPVFTRRHRPQTVPTEGEPVPAFTSKRRQDGSETGRAAPRMTRAGPPTAADGSAEDDGFAATLARTPAPPRIVAKPRSGTALPEEDTEGPVRPDAKTRGGRLGLYLTVGLLAVMALVALWSIWGGEDDATAVTEDASIEAPVPSEEPAEAVQDVASAEIAPGTDGPDAVEPAAEDALAALLPAPAEGGSGASPIPDRAPPPLPLSSATREEPAEAEAEVPAAEEPAELDIVPLEEAPAAEEADAIELAIVPLRPEAADADAAVVDDVPPPGTTEPAAPDPEEPEVADVVPSVAGPSSDQLEPEPEVAVDAPATVATADPTADEGSDAVPGSDVPQADSAPQAASTEEAQTDPLVIATPEGALAPGGYVVRAGRPDVMPEPRPASASTIAPETDVPAAEEEDPATELLRRVRPTPRPQDAALPVEPPDETEPEGRVAEAGPLPLRPRARPVSAEAGVPDAAQPPVAVAEDDPAVAAAAAAAAASLARQPTGDGAQTAALTVVPTAGAALARSGRPSARPGAVEQRAAALVAQRRARAAAAASTASTARTNPPAATPAPTPPARTADRQRQQVRSAGGGVARAATQVNAIRLRDVNLIGVYGQPQKRRALVRLGNGRYVKVEVGDRLDRGRVTAIGDAQLIYQRGGRSRTLSLPRG